MVQGALLSLLLLTGDAAELVAELGLETAPVASRDLPGWRVPRRIVVAAAVMHELKQRRQLVKRLAAEPHFAQCTREFPRG